MCKFSTTDGFACSFSSLETFLFCENHDENSLFYFIILLIPLIHKSFNYKLKLNLNKYNYKN